MTRVSPSGAGAAAVSAAALLAALLGALSPAPGLARSGPPPPRPLPPAEERFVGSSACQECHPDKHQVWSEGRHSKMLQPASPSTVLGDFGQGTLRLRGQKYALRSRQGTYSITESYVSGEERERTVHYTLGSRRVQHYLSRLEDGRIVVLPPSWDVQRRRWFHNLEIVDPEEADGRRKVQVWNTNCFGCHVSRQEKNYDPATGTYDTRWQDFGTGCERCHGPGEAHVRAHRATGGAVPLSDPAMVVPHRLSPERSTAVCAQCHSLRDVSAPGFAAGADYYDHFLPVLEYGQKAGRDPAYWPDGRPRRFSNDALGLWQSRCFVRGGATCLSCHHDPHRPDIERNPQLAPAGSGLCVSCHPEIGREGRAHTRHEAGSPGSSCVECHMPRTVVSLNAQMRDHTLSVPAPELTLKLGIPNACNSCHQDRDAAWALRALEAWGGGAARRRAVARATAFEAGRRGEAGALAPLLALATDPDEAPVMRANALGHLGRQRDAAAVTALLRALGDPHPLPRAVAAFTLADRAEGGEEALRALTEALADRRRVVRMAAALALINRGRARLPGEAGDRLEQAKQDHARRAALLDDDAGAQLQLGKLRLLDRDAAGAGAAFEAALRLEPALPGGRYFLGLARLGQQRVDEGRRELERVGPQDPWHAEARRLLARLPR